MYESGGLFRTGMSGLDATCQPNTMSAEERGAPSCHLMLGRRLQVCCIVPSGKIRSVPSSEEGSFAATRASMFPRGSVETRASVWISPVESAPPVGVPSIHGAKVGMEFNTPDRKSVV